MAETQSTGASLPANQDDFRKIKKITQPIARALVELEIYRYADLARLTPARLADLLRGKNVPFISAQRIEREDWIGQASALMDLHEAGAPAGESTKKTAGPAASAGSGSWRELAHFVVTFGNRVSSDGTPQLKTIAFSQADQDMEWDGVASGEDLVRWMVHQAGLPGGESPARARPETPTVIEPRSAQPPGASRAQKEGSGLLAVSDLWVSQVKQAGQGQRQIRIDAKIDIPTEARVFQAGPTVFMVNVFLVNTQTNGSIFIETPTVRLSQYDLPYSFQHDFPVPPPGRYQLYLIAGLPSAGIAPIMQQGPLVRVEG